MTTTYKSRLAEPLELPCGAVLKNRVAKSAMSDSMGDGRGHPTDAQIRLYRRWSEGGLALSIIGEVQGSAHYPEKPGNLVLNTGADPAAFRALAQAGQTKGAQLWAQLGHAGAMADAPISHAKGPSALDLPGLTCGALSLSEIKGLPDAFAQTARMAQDLGFGGVEIHAAHGFLLSQFLSPLFNQRGDAYGGDLKNRARLTFEVVEAVRGAVDPSFPVGIKLNTTDHLQGGFEEQEALEVIADLDRTGIDLIDLSGGTYFPGAPSSSDRAGSGPYFVEFANAARKRTQKPLMVTGGFKTYEQAEAAVANGSAHVVGLGRALILDPDLPDAWTAGHAKSPQFPRFADPPEGGVTAWFTMQMSRLAQDETALRADDMDEAITAYAARDDARRGVWKAHFKIKT
ncbi:MAG: NADH:flavin oxidoreductase/NADH oxidase family protein [Pseudomonadota bacterium]